MANFDEGIAKLDALAREWPAYVRRRNRMFAIINVVLVITLIAVLAA